MCTNNRINVMKRVSTKKKRNVSLMIVTKDISFDSGEKIVVQVNSSQPSFLWKHTFLDFLYFVYSYPQFCLSPVLSVNCSSFSKVFALIAVRLLPPRDRPVQGGMSLKAIGSMLLILLYSSLLYSSPKECQSNWHSFVSEAQIFNSSLSKYKGLPLLNREDSGPE